MKQLLSCRTLLISLVFFFKDVRAQSDRITYAVTSINNSGKEWIALRKMDTRTGKFGSMILNMTNRNPAAKPLSTSEMAAINAGIAPLSNISANNNQPGNTGVAAIAYDRKFNRLYYVPINDDQLRYVDLATMVSYSGAGKTFSKAGNYVFQPGDPITRLVIAPDDYGYTITNDGNHLIRFTTNGTPAITDLGNLTDDPHNNEMTIHSSCANAGGDMVADNSGNLYLVTASNRVFKVTIKTRLATYVATIAGLPAQFTTNGAAVNENGQLIVSSSLYTDACFIVDPQTWKVIPGTVNHQLYGVADLASSNVLRTKKTGSSVFVISWPLKQASKVKVFPNPVLFDQVNVQFAGLPPGNYTIELVSALGKTVMQQKATISVNVQTEVLQISTITAQGFYYIRVLNEKQNIVSVQKLVVERD
ncbi:MAG: T9SS type A sorting domain-containing protein [Niastella sp.]|uniref:T9SS type A sorting domain-containing protein n=1 Tax=Niastella sp. TaxID=1869183 RepID=UPI00389A3E0A